MVDRDERAAFKRLGQLFDELVDLTPDERVARLAELEPMGATLAARLDAMLAAEDAEQPLLDGGAAAVVAAGGAGPGGALEGGQTIGPYAVVDVIGAGGMGEVYLAERADGQFEQRVAIKVLRQRATSSSGRARFLAERQILAGLTHPNIAGLLDGGVLDDGRPWFAMPFVDGAPLHTAVQREGLGLEERLELFATICDAVHFAHTRLVVHRDLKPDNIFIDSHGVPQLLDFGIAKVVDPASTAEQTTAGERLMTPTWASPEQMRAEPVTTATDVHALGMILYQLLAGTHAHPPASSWAELETLVCEVMPRPPSEVAGRGDLRASTSTRQRSHTTVSSESDTVRSSTTVRSAESSWRRAVRGDLDTICLKALRKEPERRYQSAASLAEDIRRYLRGLPVSARPDTASYRLGKFVRRHRWGLGVAVVVLAGVAILSGAFLSALATERDRAQEEAAKATATAAVMQQVIEGVDPAYSRGTPITAEHMLDHGAKLVGGLGEQPSVQAPLLATIGRSYGALGKYDKGIEQLRRVVGLRMQRDSSATLDEVLAAQLDLGEQLLRKVVIAESSEIATGCGLVLSAMPHAWALKARAETLIGHIARTEAAAPAATAAFMRALDATAGVAGEQSAEQRAKANEGLALVAYDAGDYLSAEQHYRAALDLTRSHAGELHPKTAALTNDLGSSLRHQGKLTEAAELYEQALAMGRKLFGDVHPDIGLTLNHLGRLAHRQGRYADAEPLLREGLEIRRKVWGDAHPAVSASRGSLGGTLNRLGRGVEAEALYRDALAAVRKTYGDKHPYVAGLMNGLGNALAVAGKREQAEATYRESLRLGDEVLPAGHVRRSATRFTLGRLLRETNRAAEAKPLLATAVALRAEKLGEDHVRTALVRTELGAVLVALGEPDGRAQLERAHQTLSAALGAQHPDARIAFELLNPGK